MYVYSMDDINVQSTINIRHAGRHYATERLSSAKLLPHTAHSGW